MAVTINGNGTITGIAVGGLPDGIVDNGTMADDAVAIADLAATGTASSTTFLRGDNSWQEAGGGMHTQIGSTQTLSGQSSCNFESGFTSTYKTYLIRLENITMSTNYSNTYCRVGTGGTPTYQTGSVYQWHGDRMRGSSGTHEHYNWNVGTYIKISDKGAEPPLSESSANFDIYIYNPASTTTRTLFRSVGITHDSTDDWHHESGGAYKATTAVTAIKLYPTAGTFSGTFKLYGLN
tara:strand:- start:355 stop:1062 length:708 start_codon:yes stop_codon:yes gene_type:complete